MKEAKVLLYYLYREIGNVEDEKDWQLRTCEELEILGRIRIAREGINGTVGGAVEGIVEYEKRMTERELFRGIDFKSSMADFVPFTNLFVQVRPEVVTLGVDRSKIDLSSTGVHLTPEEFHEEILHADDRTVVIDIRNEYESKIGKFDGAVVAPLRQFSDLPRVAASLVDQLHLKDKKVLMYCTGGVRCELGSALFRNYGIDQVFQLSGGIHNYLETFRSGGE
uniref:Rhodanese domain-containing protein n=1 Tax=Rhodosorus marinus TaxID=101924 RepID=A0A7S3AAV0_9RHOD|mmetsp:Transcript_9637/g.41453  ORF Transcript_9637/g.41453 Transcript_9637/m.41453 type:complete len:223 (+) Transcript_9637:423-1091(+)